MPIEKTTNIAHPGHLVCVGGGGGGEEGDIVTSVQLLHLVVNETKMEQLLVCWLTCGVGMPNAWHTKVTLRPISWMLTSCCSGHTVTLGGTVREGVLEGRVWDKGRRGTT